MDNKKLLATIEGLFDKYLDLWVEVCNEESPTNYKEGVDAAGRIFIREAEKLGFKIETHKENVSGDALCITMNEDAGEAPIVFSGHLDTVHPVGLFGSPATRIEGNKIIGPGVVDCKGGCVAALMAMEALLKNGYKKRPVKLVLQSDEEISSGTSEKRTIDFMEKCSRGCVAFLNTEPADSYIITVARKGIIRYTFDISGIAAHSSICHTGASAIAEAAHKILELEKFKDKDGITCNCGVIKGGDTPNTVAGGCSFLADFRYKTAAELEEIKTFVAELEERVYVPGTKTKVSIKSQRVSMEKNEKNIAVAERLIEIAKELGLPPRTIREKAGGADSADMTSRGITAVDSVGVVGGRFHSAEEYGYVDSLCESAKLMAAAAELL